MKVNTTANANKKDLEKFTSLQWVALQALVLNSLIILELRPYDDSDQTLNQERDMSVPEP